jgi:hypothetical protein
LHNELNCASAKSGFGAWMPRVQAHALTDCSCGVPGCVWAWHISHAWSASCTDLLVCDSSTTPRQYSGDSMTFDLVHVLSLMLTRSCGEGNKPGRAISYSMGGRRDACKTCTVCTALLSCALWHCVLCTESRLVVDGAWSWFMVCVGLPRGMGGDGGTVLRF